MSNQRTHYATTSDGVTLGGTVHGQGPPLVFLQGAIGDGDLDWLRTAGHLIERYTCHLVSQRGRGLSGDHPDVSTSRLVDDAVTYVDSIGQPSGVVGWSGGAAFALGVAARSDMVAAVAPVEPGLLGLVDNQEQARTGEIVTRTAELATGGELVAAVRAFCHFPFNEREIAQLQNLGYLEAAARYVPNLLSQLQQAMQQGSEAVEDPAVLTAISAPMLVLVGSDTTPFLARSARYVADHVHNARMQEIPDVGHAAPLTHPEALAKALSEFFDEALQPVISGGAR